MAAQRPVVLETTNYELEVLLSTDVIDPTALGTGTANNGTFLRGDNAWSSTLFGTSLSLQSTTGSPVISAIGPAGQNASISLAGNGTTVGTSDFLLRQDSSSIAQIVQRANADLRIQVNGSEQLRIIPAGAWGLGGANYGTSGQVLTSQGSSSPPIWTTVSGGAASINKGTATVDFGVASTGGTQEASVAVTGQTGILTTSVVWLEIKGDATSSNRTAKDHRYLQIFAELTWGNVVAGTGFTIYVTSSDQLTGQYTINWYWS